MVHTDAVHDDTAQIFAPRKKVFVYARIFRDDNIGPGRGCKKTVSFVERTSENRSERSYSLFGGREEMKRIGENDVRHMPT
jgi:hypothetical protein